MCKNNRLRIIHPINNTLTTEKLPANIRHVRECVIQNIKPKEFTLFNMFRIVDLSLRPKHHSRLKANFTQDEQGDCARRSRARVRLTNMYRPRCSTHTRHFKNLRPDRRIHLTAVELNRRRGPEKRHTANGLPRQNFQILDIITARHLVSHPDL